VISVTCDRESAISRIAARGGMSRHQAEARLRAQMDAVRKADASDYVIDNSGTLDETRRQVERLVQTVLG
jgi:dephospho-CoA kinase